MALILQQNFKLEVVHINSHLGNFIQLGNLMLQCLEKLGWTFLFFLF